GSTVQRSTRTLAAVASSMVAMAYPQRFVPTYSVRKSAIAAPETSAAESAMATRTRLSMEIVYGRGTIEASDGSPARRRLRPLPYITSVWRAPQDTGRSRPDRSASRDSEEAEERRAAQLR